MKAVDSPIRDIIKYILGPFKGSNFYSYLQAWSMSRDIKAGRFIEPEIELLPYAVKKGEVVLDVGANYGLYTYYLSKLVGESGEVIAFEPIPFTYRTLLKVLNIFSLKNISAHMLAVSDKDGVDKFKIPLQAAGHLMAGQAYLGSREDQHGDVVSQVRWSEITEIECETIALDNCDFINKPISFIKLDIEGAEIFALEGARKIICTDLPTLIMEINPWFLEGFSKNIEQLINPLVQIGYKVYRYENKSLIEIKNIQSIVEENYVFIHSNKLSRFEELIK